MNEEFVSKKFYDELQEKLKFMKTVRRREITKAVKEAREAGDLRENSAYHEAKKDQSMNEMRIKELEERLKNIKILEESSAPRDRVSTGATVKAINLDTEETFEYTIVAEVEADIFQNKISSNSPIGGALMGCKKNDVVKVEVPNGIRRLKVLEIS